MKLINAILKDEAGATAIEYGLIAALIAVALIVALGVVSTQLQSTFNAIGSKLSSVNTTV